MLSMECLIFCFECSRSDEVKLIAVSPSSCLVSAVKLTRFLGSIDFRFKAGEDCESIAW